MVGAITGERVGPFVGDEVGVSVTGLGLGGDVGLLDGAWDG